MVTDDAVVDLGILGLTDARLLGRGGFGSVYRAEEPALHRAVAVKVLTPLQADEPARVNRELRALGTLGGHPHIVMVHGTGITAHGSPYIVMELMTGSLGDRLADRGPLPWGEVAAVGVQIAGALETAHRAGILHRDLKPENILVSSLGEVKLADFGIARVDGGTQTNAGTVTTSLAYAAPEILAGQGATATSDVYGLAAALFSLLAGSSPFVRPEDQSLLPIIQRIAVDPVPDLRLVGVPAPVCEVLERALAKDPAARHATALDLARALQGAQAALGQNITPVMVAGEPDVVRAAPESVVAEVPAAPVPGATVVMPTFPGIVPPSAAPPAAAGPPPGVFPPGVGQPPAAAGPPPGVFPPGVGQPPAAAGPPPGVFPPGVAAPTAAPPTAAPSAAAPPAAAGPPPGVFPPTAAAPTAAPPTAAPSAAAGPPPGVFPPSAAAPTAAGPPPGVFPPTAAPPTAAGPPPGVFPPTGSAPGFPQNPGVPASTPKRPGGNRTVLISGAVIVVALVVLIVVLVARGGDDDTSRPPTTRPPVSTITSSRATSAPTTAVAGTSAPFRPARFQEVTDDLGRISMQVIDGWDVQGAPQQASSVQVPQIIASTDIDEALRSYGPPAIVVAMIDGPAAVDQADQVRADSEPADCNFIYTKEFEHRPGELFGEVDYYTDCGDEGAFLYYMQLTDAAEQFLLVAVIQAPDLETAVDQYLALERSLTVR